MINKKPVGRPQKVDYAVMSKLEDALQYGASVSEACYHAGISRDTFYRYFRGEEAFARKMEAARNKLLTIAKANVAKGIMNGDYESSVWLLEKAIAPSLTIADEVSKVQR
jgi:AcrR family transcriptional regulator